MSSSAPSAPVRFVRGILLFLLGGLAGAVGVYAALGRQPSTTVLESARPGPQPAVVDPATPATDPVGSRPSLTAAAPPAPAPVTLSAPGPVAPVAAPASATGDLLIPVQGVQASQLVDTFTQSRSGGRVHDAIDIMAAAGTPVLAAADGKVAKLFNSKLGGITLYQWSTTGDVVFYYAHLQDYAPGITEGMAIRRGDVLGHVGSTGDANPAAPHLHFEILLPTAEHKWWKGTDLNPYPVLAGRQSLGAAVAAASAAAATAPKTPGPKPDQP